MVLHKHSGLALTFFFASVSDAESAAGLEWPVAETGSLPSWSLKRSCRAFSRSFSCVEKTVDVHITTQCSDRWIIQAVPLSIALIRSLAFRAHLLCCGLHRQVESGCPGLLLCQFCLQPRLEQHRTRLDGDNIRNMCTYQADYRDTEAVGVLALDHQKY